MDQQYKMFLLCLVAFAISDCKSDRSFKAIDEVPQMLGFDTFYLRFHEDTTFQLSRIIFPLEGKPEQMDTVDHGSTYYWAKETWLTHLLFNEQDTSFGRHFQIIDSTLLRETIFHKTSGFRMERRFSYMQDGWHLIYYAPMRQPVRIEIN